MNKPFMLGPEGKDYIWGGRRLIDSFSKKTEMETLAETWELSTHEDGKSRILSGEHKGRLLNDVLKEFPEYAGTHPVSVYPGSEAGKRALAEGLLPVLVKLIDADKDLSVQVHPDDDYANINENGSLGKSEMWYVIDADKDAEIVYGFKEALTRDKLRESIEKGTIEKYLNYVKVHKNDVFFIPAGTVHAIGKGILIAEVQESSNLTYRLYDYDRTDKSGKKRELHIDKALEVTDFGVRCELKQPMRVLKYKRGYASELLAACKYFITERILINTEKNKEMSDIQSDETSFILLLCYSGCGTIFGEDTSINFFKGDSVFIPASSIPLKIHGRAEFISVKA